ncbi:MAG: hypothetical protein RIQ60_3103 [Pseudomonadota bacterium]|jgi:uncharacterized membrane protein YjgN (DUF898 family)
MHTLDHPPPPDGSHLGGWSATFPAGLQTTEHPARHLEVSFEGSGSEYFRIWIVNLLLIVVTLGLYYPFARARRLAYFYGNTRVGDDPLAFHGRGGPMLKGYLIAALLLGGYFLSQQASLWVAGLMLLLLVGLAPALFRSGQRFRMGQTSWRGLRMGFAGSRAGAYQALGIVMVVGAIVLGSNVVALTLLTLVGESGQALFGLVTFAAMLATPYCQWRIKTYQHRRYRYGNAAVDFTAPAIKFYRANFRGGVVMVGAALFAGMMVAVIGPLAGLGPFVAMFGVLAAAAYLAAWAFYLALIQNLVWNATQGPLLQFSCNLAPGAAARLAARNLLLTVLTLGFYRPFAAVAMARLRLTAMSVVVAADFEQQVRAASGGQTSASGDAVGDLFGLDVGF